MELNPGHWDVNFTTLKYRFGNHDDVFVVEKGEWKYPFLAGHRPPTRSERNRLLAAMDRLMAARLQKVIDDHNP